MSRAVKTAISLPLEEFKMIEVLRRKNHQSRSEVIREAIHTWLKVRKTKSLEQKYVEGYRKHPEKSSEVEAFFRTGLGVFDSKEKW